MTISNSTKFLSRRAVWLVASVALVLAAALVVGVPAPVAFVASHALALTGGVLALMVVLRRLELTATASHAQPDSQFVASSPFDPAALDHARAAAEAAGIRVFDWDVKNRKLVVDKSRMDELTEGARAAGNDPDEFIKRIVHAEDLARYRETMIGAIKSTGDKVLVSYRSIENDGSARPVQLHGKIVRDLNGRAVRVLGIIIDMTAQVEATRRIEEQARDQQRALERLDLATQAAGIGIWDMDLVKGQLAGDQNMASLWRQRDKDAFPDFLPFLRGVIHPDDQKGLERAFGKSMKYGVPLKHRYRSMHPDGSIHHIQIHGKTFRDEADKPVRFLAVTVNIDAQMEAAQALEEHSRQQAVLLERLNLAARVGGIGVWDWDLLNNRMMVDAGIARACGLDSPLVEGDVVGFCERLVHPEDVAGYQAALQAGLASGKSFSHRYRIAFASGEIRHVQYHSRVFRDESGRAIRMLGVTLNVTDEVERAEELRLQAEEERTLRDRLNLATETAGIGVWDMDLATRKIVADAYTHTILGCDEPLTERVLKSVIHAEDAPNVWAALATPFHDPSRDGVAIRHRIVRQDGATRHIQTHVRVFRHEGVPQRMLGVTWDVTNEVEYANELKRQAEDVKKLHDRLSVSSRAAGISAWEVDLGIGQIVWVDNRTKAFGLDEVPVENLVAEIKKIVVEEDQIDIDRVMLEAIKSGQHSYDYRYRIRKPDGTIRHLQSYVHILRDDKGRATHLLGATSDITNEVQTTALLQRQAEQERALSDRLAIATEAANIGRWEIDIVEGKFLWAENLIDDLRGTMRAGTTMDEYRQHIHPEDREVMLDAIRAAFKTKSDRLSCRYRIYSASQQIVHVQVYGKLIKNEQGRVTSVLGISWDITKEILAAQALEDQIRHGRMLLDRLSMATEAAGICSWEIDLDVSQFLWSENWLHALGDTRPPDGLDIETFLRTRLHAEDREVFTEAIRETFRKGGDRFSCKYRALDEAGNVVYIQSDGRLMKDENGRARRLLGISQDITSQVVATRELQTQQQQRSQLLERLKLASESAGICSFEIDLERGVFLWSENPIRSVTLLEDLRGMPVTRFGELIVHPEDRNVLPDAVRQALKNNQRSCRFRYRGMSIVKENAIVYVDSFANIMVDPATGRPSRLLGVSWDVTSAVEASLKLAQQSERLSIATQVADISSWELTLGENPEFLWIDNPIEALNDLKDDPKANLAKFQQRIVRDDQYVMRNEIAKAMRLGTDRISYRYRAIGLDGNIVHVQNYVKLTFDEHGHPVSALGASWNATKEIQAAERLEQQAEQLSIAERRLERASLSSSEGHWEADLINERVWFSSSYHVLLGYKEGELENQFSAFYALFHPDDVTANRDALQRHLEDAVPYAIDSRLRCANGGYRWFRQRGTAERDANGAPVTMAGSIHDIHEQKLAENALQLAQRRFERAINGTQDGLWELEANGIAWSSPRVGELLGYSPEEFSSSTNFLRDHLHPEDADGVAAAAQAHFQQEHPYDVEVRLRTKTGEHRWYRARAKAERDAEGRPLRMSGSLQDVTEARTAREALVRATEAAEAASRAKTFFLANVSHEIRTPMNGIIGMTGLLLDTSLDRSQRDYAETIRGSADSLLTVINDILDFSKIEAGKLEIEAIELDLRGNVEDVGGMMALQAAAKNLELIVHVHPDIPDRVIGDPQRIRQCLINLVGNAIKFTREGEIVIEVGIVEQRDGKAFTQFQVRDTGIGIAPETLRTLFQPFVQADASTTRHFGGTGLGLSIVRRLVEMMDGTVSIESEVGKGSTFSFTLPLTPTQAANPQRQVEPQRLGRRVLIVDDHETNRRVLAGQLMHGGFEVSLATNGTEALQLLRQGRADNHPYDVVLADYQMADMDGAALGERINADPHLSRARIVILTSLDRHGDIRRFASLGFAGYLTKPVKARELFECMDRVLAREAKEWHLQSQPLVTRGALMSDESARRYAGHVLLVEDNPVNQKVAVRVLERMGCKVRVADNGAEGVKAYQEARFDLVLMDLQMPVMDGLTATRRIREIEAGQSMTPIVALTANAMHGQLERCMAAGMNGFLTKPLEINRLHDTLEQYGLRAAPTDSPQSGANTMATPVNLARLNEITDGDPEFAYELAATFVSSGEQVLEEVRVALEAFDRNALSRAAHKLKGASANIHAEALRDLAYALETQAASVDQPRLKELVQELRAGFDVAAEFLKEQAPPPAQKAG